MFGDIGTSPLYAFRETLSSFPVIIDHILGVLSLISWSLILIISIKYLVIIFRANNEGEGGVLALLALLKQKIGKNNYLYFLAIFGSGLILGDGMITPAISVLSAVEGLKPLAPIFNDLIIPIAASILFLLFYVQSQGSLKIGSAFGVMIFIWFITIGFLGLWHVILHPDILKALNPYYAIKFLYNNGFKGFLILGAVFLAVTGGEALYADLGHFGPKPIRTGWFMIVFPALILNYFGQGANLLNDPTAILNPFFTLAPHWFYLPLVVIATVATIIASQAVISATFSITKQAILLGLAPRIPIIQTSKKYFGQIYIPQMNFILLTGTLLLVFIFKNSSAMAHAYGIAVNLDMLIVTLLVTYTAKKIWNWSITKILCVFSGFLFIDLCFFIANSYKFSTGGWVPVCFAITIAFIMFTWRSGLIYLKKNFYMKKDSISKIIRQLQYKSLQKIPNLTAVFVTDVYDRSGGSFLNFLKMSLTVPEHILIINYKVKTKPYVSDKQRFRVHKLEKNIYQIILHYGFMDLLSIPKALEKLNELKLLPFLINVSKVTFLLEVPNIVASKTKRSLLFYEQEQLFCFLMRNYSANLNIEFYHLPFERTIALGTYFIL